MLFRQLLDPETSTFTYLLADVASRDAVLIDPVREQIGRDTQILEELGLQLRSACALELEHGVPDGQR